MAPSYPLGKISVHLQLGCHEYDDELQICPNISGTLFHGKPARAWEFYLTIILCPLHAKDKPTNQPQPQKHNTNIVAFHI